MSSPFENRGVRTLPQFQGGFPGSDLNPDDYPPLTAQSNFNPSFREPPAPGISAPAIAPTPSAGGWFTDASGNLTGGSRISSGGWNIDESGNLVEGPGIFRQFFNTLTSGLTSGVGGLLGRLGRPSSATPPNRGGSNRRGSGGGPMMNNTTYNSYRSPFSSTYQQLAFPGSAIGPLSGRITNPFNPNRTGASMTHSTAIPSFARANLQNVRSKNII